MIKYSIITPVYNRADCILRCLESVERQLGWNVEIEHIVVDDGSNDDTPTIIADFASNHNHVIYIPLPQNRGTNASRNAAIAKARGEWCIILDSDDYFVPNAIDIINQTICSTKAGHYCFATDDRLGGYQENPLLKGKQSVMLSYEDFLLGRVDGDFVHVVKSDILRRYPFDETLKIYEGIFFLSFYKEAENILFTNNVVTCRERSRKDSVSWTAIRTDKAIVRRSIKADRLFLKMFENDLLRLEGGLEVIEDYKLKLFENELLLGEYDECRLLLEDNRMNIPVKWMFIYNFRFGEIFYIMMRVWLFLKFKVLKKKIG